MTERMTGYVTCDLHPQSCYARIECPRHGEELPVSLKATFRIREGLKRGAMVTVERTTGGYKGWRIVSINGVLSDKTQTVKETKTMTIATEDKLVRFHLPVRYYTKTRSSSGMMKDDCVRVMSEAFSMMQCHARNLLNEHPNGFNVICRQDQFTRFIIARHEYGNCINGIKDLSPKLVDTWTPTLYDTMEKELGVCRSTLEKVMKYAGIENRKVQQDGIEDFSDHDCCEDD